MSNHITEQNSTQATERHDAEPVPASDPENRSYDADLRCTACGEHVADPHAPECDERYEAAHPSEGDMIALTDENGAELAVGDRIIPNTDLVDDDLFSTATVLGEDPTRPGYLRIEWDVAGAGAPEEDTAEAARSRRYGGPAQ